MDLSNQLNENYGTFSNHHLPPLSLLFTRSVCMYGFCLINTMSLRWVGSNGGKHVKWIIGIGNNHHWKKFQRIVCFICLTAIIIVISQTEQTVHSFEWKSMWISIYFTRFQYLFAYKLLNSYNGDSTIWMSIKKKTCILPRSRSWFYTYDILGTLPFSEDETLCT